MWARKFFEDYESRLMRASIGGGAERMAKLRQAGKQTARERLATLFDGGTYQEIGAFVESRSSDFDMPRKRVPGDGSVVGCGLVNGVLVFAAAQDFTVSGGSGGEEHLNKIVRALDMAIDARAPFVSINESGGARIEEGICALASYSRLFYANTRASGLIPQIAVILGNCAGGASYSPALCDFVFMLRDKSQMYITGPQVIKAVTGKTVSMEELGGAAIHSRKSGQAHFLYDDEKECLNGVRKLLNMFSCPQTERHEQFEPSSDLGARLQEIVPDNQRKAYNVKDVILELVDRDSFIEVSAEFAKNIVVGFARFNGRRVGIVANQPNFTGGALDCNASDKAARFVRCCDCFEIPILTLVDVPGFLPGVEQEYQGILRHGSKLLYAYSEATVPKITVILRKAYGGAYCAMGSKNLGADLVYAWPIAEVAVMGAEAAINVIYRKRLNVSKEPEKERQQLTQEYESNFLNPYYAAQRGFVDEVILPEETRQKVLTALFLLSNKRRDVVPKKHGNIPL